MLIALDYDGTYTKDPALWNQFIIDAVAAGHRIVTVTMRGPRAALTVPMEVFYTGGTPKADYVKAQGLKVDIWIDDDPWLIHHPPERF